MALREVFAKFGFEFDRSALNEANRGVDSLAGAVQGLVAVFAGNEIVQGIGRLASQLDQFDDLSAQTKLSTDSLQEWSYAAKISGSSGEEFASALTLLQKGLGNADAATSTQAKALRDLGIEYKNAAGEVRPLAEILPEVLNTFKDLPSDAKKAEVATALFGRAGVRMIPTLERGQEGFAELRKEIEAFGGVVDEEAIKNAGEFKDAMVGLDTSMLALKGTLAREIFPQLSSLITSFAKMVGGVSEFTRGTTLAQNAGAALAFTLAGPVFNALRPFLVKGLKFAAIYGAVDDALAFLNGKGSIIADALDAFFGHGTADAARDWANDAIDQLLYFVDSADGAYATLESTQATTFQKMLAGVGLLVNGSVDTFAAISEGWESILLDMTIAIDEFILSISTKWNQMVDSLVGNAGPLSGILDFLKVDDKSSALVNEEGLAARRKRRDDLRQTAFERETGQGAFAGGRRGEEARRRAGQETRGFNGLTASQQSVYDATPEEQRYLLAFQPRETRRDRVNREASARAEVSANADAAAPVLARAAQAGTTATLVDAKTVTLQFAKGTSAADRAEIQKAVQDVLRSENRTALEALTQQVAPKAGG